MQAEQGPAGAAQERAWLVALDRPDDRSGWTAAESLAELARLADTAGARVVGQTVQRRSGSDPATYIGEGKAAELAALWQGGAFDVLIVDAELSPAQQRNLERHIGCPVIDRTAVILDIFAGRARTREARLQVELAQLNYRLPRLTGQGGSLSRLGGGIGTRGPGETKLETDRRRIRTRIAHLRRELERVRRHRARLRQERRDRRLPIVALCGYTNAGKSTLMRALTGAAVLVEDRLFATLDATARRVEARGAEPYLLIDTVGFIHKLPHHLVAAFRSTLEEVQEADLELHVVDSAHPKMAEQMQAVQRVLRELGAEDKPVLTVFNKVDQLDAPGRVAGLLRAHPGAVAVSAVRGWGLPELGAAIQAQLSLRRQVIEVVVPYDRADLLALAHARGRVLRTEHRPEGTYLLAELERALAGRIQAALAEEGQPSTGSR